jgi:phosphopantothenoylcysteine decarboxylase/phosphopantothenate--cysteine ligase
MKNKNVVIGVCGGIAAYKAAALTSKLVQAGAHVHVIMTTSAQKFITPLTFQALSKQRVYVDTFDEIDSSVISHIALADLADAIIIAPATAHVIAKLAYGLADDMLTTTILATRAPIFIAPAMNVHMWENKVVQQNIEILRLRGAQLIEPGEGQLACGYEGKGRLAEPEQIVHFVTQYFSNQLIWAGKKVLVTAGGTRERIDPVRYITNDSSGKMGYHIAEQAAKQGADVTLITTPTALAIPSGVKAIHVDSALKMRDEVHAHFEKTDVVFMTAAVADYRPMEQSSQKIKKSTEMLTLQLVPNPDILQEISSKKTHQFIVGFAAETEQMMQNSKDKLKRKRCDMLIANDISQPGAGFQVDTNIIHVFDAQGLVYSSPLLTKKELSQHILRLVNERIKIVKGES